LALATCAAARRHQQQRHQQQHQQRRSVAAQAKSTAKEMLAVAPENRAEVAVILDLAEQAAKGWSLTWSRFVSPPVAADALKAIGQVPACLPSVACNIAQQLDASVTPQGGGRH
jgi:2-succinyl-5-enolpyruvyl-6-hydroxy-3-cyclohexene-1-carboxylate synthase